MQLSSLKNASLLLCMLFIAALAFTSCRDKHLCPAYPYKSKMKKVENVAYEKPAAKQDNS